MLQGLKDGENKHTIAVVVKVVKIGLKVTKGHKKKDKQKARKEEESSPQIYQASVNSKDSCTNVVLRSQCGLANG